MKFNIKCVRGSEDYCPHTTNPLQLKSLCKRCRLLEELGIYVYPMPQGDWGCSVSLCNCGLIGCGEVSDGFESRQDAEEWAIKRAKEGGLNRELEGG